MQENLKNRTIYCRDNLEILQGMDSQSIDLIYLDPPFNKRKVLTASMGSDAKGSSFKDWFEEKELKKEWIEVIQEDHIELYNYLSFIKSIKNRSYDLYNYCYLSYMAIRLLEMHRILKGTGSLYFHCDETMSHFIKLLLDLIFGEENFRSHINWQRSLGHHLSKGMDVITDSIFWYSKTKDFFYCEQYEILSEEELKKKFPYTEEKTHRRFTHEKLEKSSNVSSQGEERIIQGKRIKTDLGWIWTQETFDERLSKNPDCIYWTKQGRPRYKRYEDEYRGRKVNNLWTGIRPIGSGSQERTGYPTQKPVALLERIIKASSREGDIVLDPFCGSGTTCIAAEKLDRDWIGIDISLKAYELAKKRFARVKIKDTDKLVYFLNPFIFKLVYFLNPFIF